MKLFLFLFWFKKGLEIFNWIKNLVRKGNIFLCKLSFAN